MYLEELLILDEMVLSEKEDYLKPRHSEENYSISATDKVPFLLIRVFFTQRHILYSVLRKQASILCTHTLILYVNVPGIKVM